MARILVDVKVARNLLREPQRRKLAVAAQILKRTADLYTGNDMKKLLPLWGGGVITHGQPKSKEFIIGVTKEAKKLDKKDTALDHLCRVTETAQIILTKAKHMSLTEIEDVLLSRSITMRTTKSENNTDLRNAVKRCEDPDNWEECYNKAGIEYELTGTRVVQIDADPA